MARGNTSLLTIKLMTWSHRQHFVIKMTGKSSIKHKRREWTMHIINKLLIVDVKHIECEDWKSGKATPSPVAAILRVCIVEADCLSWAVKLCFMRSCYHSLTAQKASRKKAETIKLRLMFIFIQVVFNYGTHRSTKVCDEIWAELLRPFFMQSQQ